MRTPLINLALTISLALAGCSRDSFDFKAGTFERFSFLQDISISSVSYNPETSEFRVEGVDSAARLKLLAKMAEALR